MWSAQGQCFYKGNFGFDCDFPFCFFPPLSFSFSHMNTHTAAESLGGFFLLHSFTLPFPPSLPHRLSHTVGVFSLSHFLLLFLQLPSSVTPLPLHAKEVSLYTSRRLGESCAAIIGLLSNRQTNIRRKVRGSIRNACIIWGGQQQSEYKQWIKASNNLQFRISEFKKKDWRRDVNTCLLDINGNLSSAQTVAVLLNLVNLGECMSRGLNWACSQQPSLSVASEIALRFPELMSRWTVV